MNRYDTDPKWLAHQYLNKVLDKIEEYRAWRVRRSVLY
jgi:hypothetical protein